MELFAADGHDAGGCERVTGKSGMRPHLCRLLRPAGLDRPAAVRGPPSHDRRHRPRQRHPDHPRDQVPQVPTRPAPSDHDPGTAPLRRSPRRVSCCTSVRVLLPHRAFARAHAHRRADDVPPDQAASRLDRARAHAPTAHPRPASLFRNPDYSESIAQGGWCSGWMRHRTRNNHRLFKKARTSSSGRYRFGGSCEGVVLAIAFSFSLRSACR